MMTASKRILFLSHGGGPLPLLGEPTHEELVKTLQKIASELDKPSAIIVISAHWEANHATVSSSANPALIYDYAGFPEAAYHIQYLCSGQPELAAQVQQVLQAEGMTASLDAQRGLDHGVFVPLKIMYPQADIPCVQLSLVGSLNPEIHIRMGQALAKLEMDNLLIIGSGFSFHNMSAFFSPHTTETEQMNVAFEDWLVATCSDSSLDEKTRAQRLLEWADAPYARYCHPREEHLLPLHVCYGAAQSACQKVYQITILNKLASLYLW